MKTNLVRMDETGVRNVPRTAGPPPAVDCDEGGSPPVGTLSVSSRSGARWSTSGGRRRMPMGCGLAARAAMWAPAVRGVIESMNSARFIHDRLEEDVGLDREALAARVDPGERVAAVAVRVPSRPRYRTTRRRSSPPRSCASAMRAPRGADASALRWRNRSADRFGDRS
jgi:hypothetical protein